MIKAVIFDMYETLITLFDGPAYLSEQMAEDAGIEKDKFQSQWRATETDRTIGRITVDEVLRQILCENSCYSDSKVKKIMENRITLYSTGVWIDCSCYRKNVYMLVMEEARNWKRPKLLE